MVDKQTKNEQKNEKKIVRLLFTNWKLFIFRLNSSN